MSTNPFDEFRRAQPAANPFDEFQPVGPTARQTLTTAVTMKPDSVAEAARLAKRYPAPPEVIMQDLEAYRLQEVLDLADTDLQKAPMLREIMRRDVKVAAMAQDDIPMLTRVAQAARDVANIGKAGVFGASRGVAGTARAGLELVAPVLDVLEPLDPNATSPGLIPRVAFPGGNPLRRLAEGFGMQAAAAGRTADAAMPRYESTLGQGVASGLRSLTQNLMTLPMAFLPGGQGAALAGMTTFTGGDAYQQAREKGIPMSQALPFAASQAAVEYATEKLPLAALLKDVKAGAGFLQILGRQIALEVPGEQVATLLQDLNEWAVINPEKPFSSYLEERPNAAAQTLIATIVGTGGNVAVVKGIERLVERATRDGTNMQRAGLTAQALEQAMQGAEASRLRERNPEAFRDVMAQMSQDGSIYIDAEVLNQMPPELLQQMQGVIEALPDALAANSSVEVKLADALTVLPGTPQAEVFMQNARSAPDAPSLVEAEAAGAQAQAFLQQEAERVIAQAQDQEAMRASSEAVRQSILGELNTAGRYRGKVNEGMASWASAFYTAYSSRLGITPEEMYQRYRLRVLGQATGQGEVLNAAGRFADVTGMTTEQLRAEAQALSLRVNEAYETGNQPLAERLDARLENVFDTLESRLSELEEDTLSEVFQGFNRDALIREGEQGDTESDLVRDLANRWRDMSAGVYPYGQMSDAEKAAEILAILGDYAFRHGGLRDGLTDQQILDAARDAYDSVYGRVEAQRERMRVAAERQARGDVLEQRGVQAKGKAIPTSIDAVSNVEASFEFAGSEQFPNNRDFKLAIQGRVLEAAKAAKVKLDEFTQGVEQYLVRIAVADGQTALRTNANAVGWYNEKVTKALRLVSLIHPEIATDPQAKFAFVWAMAVTSNGLKVDKNFELAEKVYQGYKATGQMPTNVGIGTAAEAINRSLGLYNDLIAKHGFDVVEKFMTTLQPAGEVEKFTGNKVSGENKTTMVYGAAALGPKIGNGFFMNLYGRFEQLTMDRWLMRTWGRWTATLVESNPAQVKAKRTQLKALVQSLTPADKKAFEAIIKRKLTVGDIDAVGQAIWKASQKPANRKAMAVIGQVDEAGQAKLTEILGEAKKDQVRVSIGDELRKSGNALTKYLDGQKEAPAGPPERGNIRKVFQQALAELQAQHPALTMSDFQALLWYPEKRLYDAAKTADEAADAYEDDEAPDYANAAAKLARSQGVTDADISATLATVDAELQADVGAAGARPGERGPGAGAGDSGQQVLEQGPRGTFNPRTLELVLSPTADLSTFFHETGHFFLEVLADIASQPGAPTQIVEDMNAFLKWAGVPDLATWNGYTLEQKRPYHERWAEGIEQYVMEGKAPNTELQPLMRRFSAWLKSVYKSITQFVAGKPELELNDDIRRVMDRMLATDEQIQQANEVAGLVPDEQADGEAAERLQKRSMADLKWAVRARDAVIAKLKKQAREIEKATRAEVTVEVDQMPEMRAKAALDALAVTPEYAGILAEHKAQRQAAETQARQEITDAAVAAEEAKGGELKGLKKGQFLAKMKREIGNQVEARMIEWDRANPRPARPVNATDQDVATIADSFGFESVDAMLQAIDAFGPRAEAIDGLTEQRMLEENGDLIDERAIQEAANEAVHNEARARSLATELRTQREMLGQRTDTGEVNAKGSKITVNALVEAAKQFGANVIARTPLKDLKATAWKHTAAERRAGKRWAEATAKGETADAVKAKQDQVLNNAAAKAAIDAATEAKKILEFFKRVTKGNDEKTVEKGRDPDIVNAARAVLAAYGIETPTTKAAAAYLEALQQNDPETAAVVGPMILQATQNAQPLEALTFEELQGLHESVQAMWFLAKRTRQMEVDGDLMDIDDAAGELYTRMEEIGIPDTVPGESGALTKAELIKRAVLQQAPALLRRVEQWAEAKDGKFGGPFLRLIFQPIKDAADRYRAERLEYRKKFQALVDNIAPMMPTQPIEAPELGYVFGRGHNGIGMAELLHAILHTGNESNKRKLLLGRGWATENPDGTLDTSRWDAFIQRLANSGVLQREHFDFAQGVWDLLEQTKPLAQKTHRDVFGRYFAEVTADTFTDPFGVARRGGYVPAQADPLLVQDAELRDLLETENAGMSYAFPSTNRGFTKGRVEYNRPLKLDLRSLPQHIDKVLLFSHMEAPVRSAARLIKRPKVSQPLGRIDPAAISGVLKPWLNRSARQTVETPISADAGLNRMLSTIRGRVGMALMFANLSNTLQQITGLSSAAVKVKPALMMRSLADYVANPKKFAQAVWDASPYMADRASNEVAVLSDTLEKILINPSVYESAEQFTRRHSYFLQTAFDNVLSPIIWQAAYNQGLAEGMEERMATRYADGVIRQTQGSTLPEDVSRIETGPAYARVFTQFVSYFNMLANTNATALQQIAQEQGLRKGAGKAFGVLMLGLMAPIWVAEAIAIAFRGGPDDEDDDGYLDDWLAQVFGFGTIKGVLSGIPFVGALGQSVVNRFNDQPADDKFSLSPTVSVLESAAGAPASVYKAIVDDASAQKAVRDVAALITVTTGMPAMTLARPLGYGAGVAQGKIEPTSEADFVRGLVTGTASPESKVR
jgi:hypothetical protein